jgi:predicted nuclease of predicted toxin-antitoxin system
LLRDAGVDAVHTSETGLASADDRDVIGWCRANAAMVVTLDADFHALIALSGETTPSTVRIRIEGLAGPEVARIISTVLETQGEALAAGALITVQPGRLRVRRLPIARRPA